MKELKYFRIPNLWKFGIPAILIFYIIRYYQTIELYKYFVIGIPLVGIIVMRKINERYVKWDENIIKLKTPGNKTETLIKIKNVSTIIIDENKGITLYQFDNSTQHIPFEGLGRNFNVDVELIKKDFSKQFSHLIKHNA